VPGSPPASRTISKYDVVRRRNNDFVAGLGVAIKALKIACFAPADDDLVDCVVKPVLALEFRGDRALKLWRAIRVRYFVCSRFIASTAACLTCSGSEIGLASRHGEHIAAPAPAMHAQSATRARSPILRNGPFARQG
jgi:hypothetical protein